MPPNAPSGLAATAASSSQINLAWTNNATNQNGLQIQQSSDGTTFTTIGSVGAGITSYLVSGLSASTTYYFQVIAYNPVGNSAPSNVANATTASGGADVSGAFASRQVIVAGLGQTLGWSTTLGAPITLGVYVDNSDGSMTPDQRARIADAIAALNVTWNGTTGLQLVLVSDPSQASIIVHNVVTSPLGGLGQGILGDAELSYVASPDGRLDNGNAYQVFTGQMMVDIVEGWNWYTSPTSANTGMTAITNSQYDFESVVIHELGHAVGLYHDESVYGMLNGDGLSPMNPLLYAGQVHRQLSSYDVSWLKHLYANGPNPGNNEVPVPQDALRAFFTSEDDDALRSRSESGPAEAFSGSSAASASADLFAIAASSNPAISPRAPAGIFFQLGADPAAPPAVPMAVFPSIGLAGTPSLATPSEADAIGGPTVVGATPATVMSPSVSSPFSSGMTDPMQPLEDGNGAPDRGSGAASEGPAKAPVDSGATLRSGASIWDIPTLDDMTGSRLNGYRKETDSLSEVAPSIWEEPGVSEGLCLSDPAVFALSPAVAAAVLALLSDRPTKARAEDTAPFSGGIQRKNQPRPW